MVSCYVINIKKLAITDGAANGVNATHFQLLGIATHGSLYLVPKPGFRGYADILGAVACATAISNQSDENATHSQPPVGDVHGFVYLLQNPALRG